MGTYICGDLACSLYTRGKKFTASSARYQERITFWRSRSSGTSANLSAFLAKVTV